MGAPEQRWSVTDVPCWQKHPGSRAPIVLSLGGQGRKGGVVWNKWGLSSKAERSHKSQFWRLSASSTLAFPKSIPFFTGELNGTLLWLPQLTKPQMFPCYCKSKLRLFLKVVTIFCSWEPWGHCITLGFSSILNPHLCSSLFFWILLKSFPKGNITDMHKTANWYNVLEIWRKVSAGKCQGVCTGGWEVSAGRVGRRRCRQWSCKDRFLGGYSPGGSRLLKSTLFRGWEK